MISWKRGHWVAAAAAVGVPMGGDLLTLTPTVPVWD